jgi:hypothetical protein
MRAMFTTHVNHFLKVFYTLVYLSLKDFEVIHINLDANQGIMTENLISLI